MPSAGRPRKTRTRLSETDGSIVPPTSTAVVAALLAIAATLALKLYGWTLAAPPLPPLMQPPPLPPPPPSTAYDIGKPPGSVEVENPTPLMMAAAQGDAEAIKRLLQAPGGNGGGPINAYTADGGISALHFALHGRMNQMQSDQLVRKLSGKHELCIERLLKAGANPMVGHLSALWYSASFRNVVAMGKFIKAGADVNDRADGGWSLLHEVSASKAAGMARFFMKPQIDPKLLKLMRLQPLAPLASPVDEPFSLHRLQQVRWLSPDC